MILIQRSEGGPKDILKAENLGVHRMPLQVCFYFHGEVRKSGIPAPKLRPRVFNIFLWSDVKCTFSNPAFNTSDAREQTKTATSKWCHWSGEKKGEGGEIKTKKR